MGVCVCVSEQGGDDNLPSSLGSRTRGGEAAVAECGRPDVWGRGGQSHPSSMGRGRRSPSLSSPSHAKMSGDAMHCCMPDRSTVSTGRTRF